MTDVVIASGSCARLAVAVAVALLVGACTAAPPVPLGGSNGPGASTTPTVGAIDHKTGATDVILRFDESGGLVPPSFLVTEAPAFTLYGDGTAIFRDLSAPPPPPIGDVVRNAPFSVARLSEDEVQALLAFALRGGALGVARERYDLPVADAPTSVFTVHAGGVDKTVSVNGLGIDIQTPNNADAAVLRQLAVLRSRLIAFNEVTPDEQTWVPDRYRGVLLEGGFGVPQAWPWNHLTSASFNPASDPNAGGGFPMRVMTTEEIAALGVPGVEGGASGFLLRSPTQAGVLHGFAVRPLLPDESR